MGHHFSKQIINTTKPTTTISSFFVCVLSLLRFFFLPPSLQPGSSPICFCFAIVFFHNFISGEIRTKNRSRAPLGRIESNCQSDSALPARARGLPMRFFNAYFAKSVENYVKSGVKLKFRSKKGLLNDFSPFFLLGFRGPFCKCVLLFWKLCALFVCFSLKETSR